MNHSEQLNELALSLTKAQSEFPVVTKTEEGKIKGQNKAGVSYEYSYKYADLAGIVAAVQKILSDNGLCVSQFIDISEGGNDLLTTWLMHTSGQYIRSSMRLHLAKEDPQAQGSAVTYARRYAYMAALGLVADEDDDGNKATQAVSKPPYVQSKPWSSRTAPTAPEEAARDINADVKPISSATKLLLAQSVEKQHGISDMDVITAKLTSLASTNFDAPVGSITEDQGLQLLNIINKTAKGAL